MVSKVMSKETQVKRVDKNLKIKKSATKSELMLQVQNLLIINDALEESNRRKNELLESFGGKIQNLEEQIDYLSCKETLICKETQTEAGLEKENSQERSSKQTQTQTNIISKCEECHFEGSTETELDWHMSNIHRWSCDQKSNEIDISLRSQDPRNCELCEYEAENMYDFDAHTWELHMSSLENGPNFIPCTFCDDTFENNRDLMNHKKKEHTEKVQICWNFSAGACPYGEQRCWFTHSKERVNSSLSEYKCNFCDTKCVNQSELLKHRKMRHKENVPQCRNFKNGECKFGKEKCWFNHKN